MAKIEAKKEMITPRNTAYGLVLTRIHLYLNISKESKAQCFLPRPKRNFKVEVIPDSKLHASRVLPLSLDDTEAFIKWSLKESTMAKYNTMTPLGLPQSFSPGRKTATFGNDVAANSWTLWMLNTKEHYPWELVEVTAWFMPKKDTNLEIWVRMDTYGFLRAMRTIWCLYSKQPNFPCKRCFIGPGSHEETSSISSTTCCSV